MGNSVKKTLFYVVLLATFHVFGTIHSANGNFWLQKTVTGKVTSSADGLPIPGATVAVKGEGRGTMTDFEGDYSIEVSEDDVLIFSYVGFETKEVAVGDQSEIDVVLTEGTSLEEVVVVGYGKQKKVNLTGAVDQIDGEEIQNVSVPNVSRALQGRVPGLNIDFNSGRPDSSPTYNIRGLTSIGAGGSALILIDGVEGDPSTLNPQDIESVSVLKDAASAAIYGSRGAFGVVLITTKNPTGQSYLTYTGTFSHNTRTTERDIVTDSYLWTKLYVENYTNLFAGTTTPTSIGNTGLPLSEAYLEELRFRSENPDHGRPEVAVDPVTGNYQYYGNTNWWDILMAENIPSMEHSLTASGGSDEASYYLSGRYFDQGGVFKIRPDSYKTYDLRSKGSIRPVEWLNITGNLNYSSNTYVNPFSSSNVWRTLYVTSGATPVAVPYNPDGTYSKVGAGTVGVLEEGLTGSENKENQLLASVGFEASVVEDIFDIRGDFTFKNRIVETNRKEVPVPYSIAPGEITTGGGRSWLFNDENTLNYYVSNLYGNYTPDFGNHSFDIVGGANFEVSNIKFLNVNRSDLIIPELDAFNLATGERFNIDGGGSDWRNLGFFSRISYRFKEKYLLELNSRYDGSSKFPRDEQFAFFPSISAGWRISEENFIKNFSEDWLNNLKIRGSYGSLGNSQIGPYLFIPQIIPNQTSRVVGGARPVVARNPAVLPDNFTWETSTTLDFGLDLDLFNNRLGVVFDWYRRTTTDMITTGPVIPAVFGAPPPEGNYADLETEGIELTLGWRDQILTSAKPISYNVQITLADDVSYITKFNNPDRNLNLDPEIRTTGFYEGLRYGDIWGLTTLGLFADQEEIDNHADQSFIVANVAGMPAEPGDIKFADLNGDGVIDWGDRTVDNPGDLSVIGNMQPRYKFGIRLGGNYSNFSVSTFFQGVGKRDWYPTNHRNPFWGPYGYWGGEVPTHFLENSYRADNPDPNAYWPKLKSGLAYGNRQLQPQTRYLQNTAYIRLKELTIAYSSKRVADFLRMSDFRLSYSGYNIWTYSPVFEITRDIDPEQMDGGAGSYYPMLKTHSLSVSLNF